MSLRVGHHDDRLLRVFFGQKTLVLPPQVMPGLTGNLNFSFARSSHMHEFRSDDALVFADQPFLDALVEEGEVFRSSVQ
jgi:hypothetical protein